MNLLLGAKEIIDVLNKAGYEAYIVGGFVRDYLLKRKSGDIDIATSALPQEVSNLFAKTIDTGLKHGTVTVIHQHVGYEVTTFRTESTYVNNRKPEQVTFIRSLKEDVMRRDFTMNALALTNQEEIIDYVNGQEDIHQKIIKTVGDPYSRFNEDALRMLRAFRFASTLGFSIEENAIKAIEEHAHLIQHISIERIISEFEKMIKGKSFLATIQLMIESKFHEHLPFFKKGLIAIHQSNFIPSDFIEFLAICAVSDTFDQIENLPLPNFIKKEVKLIYNMYEVGITQLSKPILFRNGLQSCLVVNKLNVFLKNLEDQGELINDLYNHLPIKKQCDLKFKGDHIIELFDRTPGGWIAEILDEICLKVLLGELKNDYDEIKQFLVNKQ